MTNRRNKIYAIRIMQEGGQFFPRIAYYDSKGFVERIEEGPFTWRHPTGELIAAIK